MVVVINVVERLLHMQQHSVCASLKTHIGSVWHSTPDRESTARRDIKTKLRFFQRSARPNVIMFYIDHIGVISMHVIYLFVIHTLTSMPENDINNITNQLQCKLCLRYDKIEHIFDFISISTHDEFDNKRSCHSFTVLNTRFLAETHIRCAVLCIVYYHLPTLICTHSINQQRHVFTDCNREYSEQSE